jgi:hypothetical protein
MHVSIWGSYYITSGRPDRDLVSTETSPRNGLVSTETCLPARSLAMCLHVTCPRVCSVAPADDAVMLSELDEIWFCIRLPEERHDTTYIYIPGV